MLSFTGNRTGWGVAVLCVAQFVVVLDATVVTSGLPAMGRELDFSSAGLQWVLTAYTLTFGGLLIVGGRAADLLGSRRAFTLGVLGFTATSLLCGLAPSAGLLVTFRALQGLAAALLSPAALALLTAITPDGESRRRAVGIWTAAAAGGGATGWVLGGLLTEYADWRWIFLVNLPVGLVVLPFVAAVLPRQRPSRSGQLDVLGGAGITLALALLVSGLTRASEIASAPLLSVGPVLLGALLLGAVVRHERRAARPLLPPDLLRDRQLGGANLVALAVTASTTPAMFLAVLYVQDLIGLPPGRAALYFPALNLTVIAASLLGPRLLTHLGQRFTALVGFGLITFGAVVLLTLPLQGRPSARLLTSFAVMGFGLGLASVASTVAGTTAAPDEARGVASGLLNSSAQIGTALGLAVIVPLAARTGTAPAEVLSGMRWGFAGAAVVALLGLPCAWRLSPRRREPVAASMEPSGSV